MKTKILLLTFVLVLFQGCSTKQEVNPPKTVDSNTTVVSSSTEADELSDEYEDKEVAQEVNPPKTVDSNTTVVSSNTETDEFSDEYEEEDKEVALDPLSGYNRLMTSFNDGLFVYIMNPISKGYAAVLPQPLRIGISNFIHNIQYPIRLGNNLLQAKFKNATEETGRFIINSTVGIGGLFDPASAYLNLEAHNEDFGQTLGFYGVGAGFHVVLPFLGPSNVRDIVGLVVDGYASPIIYLNNLSKYRIPSNTLESAGIYGLQTINKNSLHLGAYETLKKDAIDLYPFLRGFYEQKRLSDIEE